MKGFWFRSVLAGSVSAAVLSVTALAADFDIPGGSLKAALNAYAAQTGVPLIYLDQELGGVQSRGVRGNLDNGDALTRILSGTGFVAQRHPSGSVGIVRGASSSSIVPELEPLQLAQATPARASVETVTVTSSKLGGADVQSVPIAITAMSQEQLTATQTAGGPDLVKNVPNLTFTKTNFTGYSIQIRGIGTQAISVATDPAVAVAFNDIDLCLRIRAAGYRNLWTPFAEFYHHESASRGVEDTPEKQARFAREVDYMRVTWGPLLDRDPAYNPNLTVDLLGWSLAWPPRIEAPK